MWEQLGRFNRWLLALPPWRGAIVVLLILFPTFLALFVAIGEALDAALGAAAYCAVVGAFGAILGRSLRARRR